MGNTGLITKTADTPGRAVPTARKAARTKASAEGGTASARTPADIRVVLPRTATAGRVVRPAAVTDAVPAAVLAPAPDATGLTPPRTPAGPLTVAQRTPADGRFAAPRTSPGAAPSGAAPRGPIAAFARFVVCGGGVSLASSAVLMAVAGRVPFALANAVVTVASTLLATELHHRFTFGTGGNGRAGWRIHAKSAATLLLAYLFTTGAVLALDALRPHPCALLTQAVYLSASGLAGTARFLALRLLVFAHPKGRIPAAAEGESDQNLNGFPHHPIVCAIP